MKLVFALITLSVVYADAKSVTEMATGFDATTQAANTQAATTQAAQTQAGNAAVEKALADRGVDNSDKQLALTLVWYRDCEMDIHAYQPDGDRIYWGNSGPLPSTGRLEMDDNTIGVDGFAIENIAWTTAPFGLYRVEVSNYESCSPGVDYKVYVRTDGVTTVYEKMAPANDSNLYEVVSFVYSQNGTSVKAASDLDTTEIVLPAE